MKINEKLTLFLIATFTTFFGITNNLLKTTEAKGIENTGEFVLVDENNGGLVDVIFKDTDFEFDSDMFSYDLVVDELDRLKVLPILSSDKINYKFDIVGNKNIDKSIIIIITIDYPFDDKKVYTFYVEENSHRSNNDEME